MSLKPETSLSLFPLTVWRLLPDPKRRGTPGTSVSLGGTQRIPLALTVCSACWGEGECGRLLRTLGRLSPSDPRAPSRGTNGEAGAVRLQIWTGWARQQRQPFAPWGSGTRPWPSGSIWARFHEPARSPSHLPDEARLREPGPATHRLPRCLRAPAAAAGRHLRREDSARVDSSFHRARCEGKGAGRGAYPPRQRTGIQDAHMVGGQGARTWERRRMQPRPLRPHPHRARPRVRGPPHSPRTPRKPRDGQGEGEPREAAAPELVAPSLAGGDARAADRARPRSKAQLPTRRSVRYEDRQTLGALEARENWLAAGTLKPTPDAGGSAPESDPPGCAECGKRGSRAAIKAAPRAWALCGGRAGSGCERGPGGRVGPSSSARTPASSLPRLGVKQRHGATPAARGSATRTPRPSPGRGRPGDLEGAGVRAFGTRARRRRDRAPAGRLRDVWRPLQGPREPACPSGLGSSGPRGGSGGAANAEALGPRRATQVHTRPRKQTSRLRAPAAANFLRCSHGILLKSGQPGCDHACPVFVRNPIHGLVIFRILGIQPPELVSRLGFCRSRFFSGGFVYCPVEPGLCITFAFSSFPD